MDFRYARPPQQPPPSLDPPQPPPQQPVPPPPGSWYPGQFQYHSPSPPPPQWAPQQQQSDHYLPPPHRYAAAPPPPMAYSSNPYSLPPRPHMLPPPPPPPQPHYPPVNQEWSNANRGHQGWDYSAHNQNEDDWAARAKAWAASKSVTDDQHQHSQLAPINRPEESQQHSFPPPNYQQYSSSFAPPPTNHLRDPPAAYPQQETAPTSLSAHQQEVPSSYSSVTGKEGLRDMNGNFYQPSHTPFASSPQHQVHLPILSNDRSISVEQHRYAFNSSAAESAPDLSNQPLDFGTRYGHDHGPFGQSTASGMPYASMPNVHPTGQQVDSSVGVPSPVSMHSTPLFGRISSFQPTMSSANTTFPIGSSNAFLGDTYGIPDRPKKASVPNWLREEIIKKKAAIGNSTPDISTQDNEYNEDDVMEGSRAKGNHVDRKSMESSRSTEEDDEEDYVEAAKTAAINQEIKRILTEVLLKVTDDLFDEIATKVLEEDDLSVEVERKDIASIDMTSATIITPKSSAKVLIPVKTKATDLDDPSSPGDLLGLGNYASDDEDDDVDDEDKKVQNPSSKSSKPTVHLAENVVDDDDVSNKKFPEVVNDLKTKQDVIVGSLNNVENSSPNDSQIRSPKRSSSKDEKLTKIDENNEIQDERHVKRVKKDDDQNGSKEKIKDRDSGKKVRKDEIKDDKKEDNRKRERGKDDKNEGSKYKSVGESRGTRRRHSPPPGGKGRSSKDNLSVSRAHGSSDSSSDDSRRKVRSKRRNLSPSPVRSRRQVSRSPSSNRSHRRHSIYSSLETTRERRRSRSRSRRG